MFVGGTMQQRVIGRRMRAPRLGMVAALLAAILLAALSATAVGATNAFSVTVGHAADNNNPTCAASGTGDCSLRDAIRFANTHTGATDLTTITLPGNIASYALTQTGAGEDNAATGDLDVKANMTIVGGGAATTVIDGVNSDRIFDLFPATVNIRRTATRPPPAAGRSTTRAP
jgi:CSLREA domain-containing protein